MKIFGISKTQKIKLDIFVEFLKKKQFLHFKTIIIFFILFCSFWRSELLLSRTLYLFSKLLSATNQQLLFVTESDIGQVPSNHTSPLYEL